MSKTSRIAELNDLCRKAPDSSDQMYLTQGVTYLPYADLSAIYEKVQRFDSFTPDNDPDCEHDFGAFEHAGHKILWKIDYYDRASYGTGGGNRLSEDPANPATTVRVLTIMLAEEY